MNAERELGTVLPDADWQLAVLKNMASCPNCGAIEPVRIESGTCSECADYPRCVNCLRWVGDGSTSLVGHEVIEWDGAPAIVCLLCIEGME